MYEVLTATDFYWRQGIALEALTKVVKALESLPEFHEWVQNGERLGQQRRLAFRIERTDDNPFVRMLFLCNNLADGKVTNPGFMKNMWAPIPSPNQA